MTEYTKTKSKNGEVSVHLYFKISNSELYGGDGTVGYTALNFGGVENLEGLDDAFTERQVEFISTIHRVTKDNVKLISKAEYDENTAE